MTAPAETVPELTEFPDSAGSGLAGAIVIGGRWDNEPAATKETSAATAPDPFDF